MKHPDETAQISAVQLAKRRKYAGDIDTLIAEYETLRRKERAASRRADDLEASLAAMRRARDNFKSKHNALNRQNQVLKETLRSLRSSQSLKLGRMITKPAGAILALPRQLASALRPDVAGNTGPADASASPKPLPPTPQGATGATSVGKVRSRTRGTASYNQLMEDFIGAPSKGSLYRLISHEYFVRGDIVIPAERIEANREVLTDLSDVEARVIENIIGQAVLLKSAPAISPRQPNYGYTPERGRVLYCAHSTGKFNSNGYSTRTAGLVAGLREHNDDVVVLARPGYPWDVKTDVNPPGPRRFEESISGVRHVYNPGPSWSNDRLDYYLAQAADIFVREAQRSRAAVIHAASNYVTALPALIAARRLGVPFVYEVRGLWEITELSARPDWATTDRYRLAAELELLVARESDEVLAITEQVRNELIRRGVDAAKIGLLPNSVDTSEFTPMPPLPGLRERLGIAADAVVVGYAGSLVAYEGLEDLLNAMKIVAERGTAAHLVVVGDGKQLPQLRSLAKDLEVQERVSFVGRVPAEAVPDYLSIFDILPCPRRRLPVTEMVSPLKPLEAMASAKAVVLTDLAPLRDIAGPNQERALLCAPGDPESLAAAILRLAGDAPGRTALGRRARLWAIEHRTWSRAGAIVTEAHNRLQLLPPGITAEQVPSARNMRIGIISDQFTLESLAPETHLVVLRPDSWRQQLEAEPIDALFVESAWEGTDGLWRRKVGFYGDEEFDVLRSLLAYCNDSDIATIFWNKEDPVHFSRFSTTATYFDHVFTTDAGCIRSYWENGGDRLKTVSSLPFYAQPRLHNILPSLQQYEHSVSYAGSFYGDKYPKRSAELATVLRSAVPHGLAIYDRQHLNPDSPYHFPPALRPFVRGGLAYAEMVEAYKAHPVHINVNSVANSPTMFSRRVMEIAASGGAVVSGGGRGVQEVLNGLVPVVSGQHEADLLISEWMSNEEIRIRDAWLAYRHVHRGHTAGHRLVYVLRTAGLVVSAPQPPDYAVFVDVASPEVVARLNRQTIRPKVIFSPSHALTVQGIRLAKDHADAKRQALSAGLSFLGTLPAEFDDRTVFEDLLTATTFGEWSGIGYDETALMSTGLGLAQRVRSDEALPRIEATQVNGAEAELSVRRSLIRAEDSILDIEEPKPTKTVLIAGHDLKFAGGIISELQDSGHTVIFDRWHDHNKHDEQQSRALLQQADVIFCEWALGNTLWYSRNKLSHQRLVTRVHSQEIFRPYLKDVLFEAVDCLIFVGAHIVDIAVRDHGVPAEKCVVVPNAVDVLGLSRTKDGEARFNLGFVGMVPAQKHLDRALDVLVRLRESDDRFRLFVKGKRPEEFSWMANRPTEMRFYEEIYDRISSDDALSEAVVFEPHGDNMADWYANIGIVLSTSDFESFHLTLADGAASGAVPVSLAWPGADQIYPTRWLHADTESMARYITDFCTEEESWRAVGSAARDYVKKHFDGEQRLQEVLARVLGTDLVSRENRAVGDGKARRHAGNW